MLKFRVDTQANTTFYFLENYSSVYMWNRKLKEMVRTGQTGLRLGIHIKKYCQIPFHP
jgi:hypothetical protein